jgi:RNA polymerase sigma-70 factor, ECF subfamily
MAVTSQADLAVAYSRARPRLVRLAYAVLGRHGEAEDVVSDCWFRLVAADGTEPIRDVEAWATVAVSGRALDVLRSARRTRESYIGPWLPEPDLVDTSEMTDPADRVTLDDTVRFALLVVLETLSPAERTAWVLHDMFGVGYDEIARVVGRNSAAVRQLATRARKHVDAGAPRIDVTPAEHGAVVDAFAQAAAEGDLDALVSLLDPNVVLTSDGGGAVRAALRPVCGAHRVATFIVRTTRQLRPIERAVIMTVNGDPGLVVVDGDDDVVTVASFTVAAGKIVRVDLVRAPAKLHAPNHQLT